MATVAVQTDGETMIEGLQQVHPPSIPNDEDADDAQGGNVQTPLQVTALATAAYDDLADYAIHAIPTTMDEFPTAEHFGEAWESRDLAPHTAALMREAEAERRYEAEVLLRTQDFLAIRHMTITAAARHGAALSRFRWSPAPTSSSPGTRQ